MRVADLKPAHGERPLAESAKASLLWGGGSTFVRDLVQFVTMLVLVRLLSPQDYGSAALAQSVIGLMSVVSFGTFVLHTLQLRNPEDIDWQAHFTAAAVMNAALFCFALAIAWGLSFSARYHSAAAPLAGAATVFLVEIAGTMRHRMLETAHDWKRFRVLLLIGTVLALAVAVLVAACGGGVWALVVQPPLLGVPAAIDLFWYGKWRPNWSWSWARYSSTATFGLNRVGSGAILRGRQTIEQSVLAGAYDFAALGVFTRAFGLATLVAGRIGSVTMTTLYPVVTRAEQRSARFQRISGLVLRGVCWTTIPAATFTALCARDIVSLLYGPQWLAVIPLLPLAVAAVALSGIASALSGLLLANNEVRTSLFIDVLSGFVVVGLAFWLVPIGIPVYLAALAGSGCLVLVVTLVALSSARGIGRDSIRPAFLPSLLGAALGAVALWGVNTTVIAEGIAAVRLCMAGALFTAVYVLSLRIGFPKALREILDVAPGGRRATKILFG